MGIDRNLLASLIAAVTSLIVAVVSIIRTRTQQRAIAQNEKELERIRMDFATNMEKVKTELALHKSQYDARLAYEFEARKRLYLEYEPLFFQLQDYCFTAKNQISGISWRAYEWSRERNQWGQERWMTIDSYFFKETIYKLFCPLAVFHLIKERVGGLDASLDPNILVVHRLGRILYQLYRHDYVIASLMSDDILITEEFATRLNRPGTVGQSFGKTYHTIWKEYGMSDPEDFIGGEGLQSGHLDNIIEAFISRSRGNASIKTFGEIEATISSESTDWLNVLAGRFKNFSPRSNKILWRVLACQANIYRIIRDIKHDVHLNNDALWAMSQSYIARERQKIGLKSKAGVKGDIMDEHEQYDIMDVVEKYLSTRLTNIV